MSEMEVLVKNSNIDLVKEELDNAIARALEAIGMQAENYAKLNLYPGHGLDTGRLRNSITHTQENENTEVIGTNVEYAPYVEMGTSKSRAQPFLEPAVVEHVDEYKEIVLKILQDS